MKSDDSERSFASAARLAQWKSTSFTRKGSQVQVLQRAPCFCDEIPEENPKGLTRAGPPAPAPVHVFILFWEGLNKRLVVDLDEKLGEGKLLPSVAQIPVWTGQISNN